MAQFWAGNCEYELNENRHTQSSTYSYVGQSLAAGSGYVQNYTIMVRRWFDMGKLYYNYYSRTCADADGNEDEEGEACWPYTQVSWEWRERPVGHTHRSVGNGGRGLLAIHIGEMEA